MTDKEYFNYIKSKNKIDIHNHATTSCRLQHLIDNNIDTPSNKTIVDIGTLIDYCDKVITPAEMDINTLRILLEGNFENCIKTNVTTIATSIDYKLLYTLFENDVKKYLEFLRSFNYDNLKILWELGINRNSYQDGHDKIIFKLLETGYFSGIDLVSQENFLPNSTFKEIYDFANSLNLNTQVHAGEQLDADYIKSCIVELNPKQIQHGITIIEDKEVMQLAKDRNIIFNVCPTSNLVLGYVDNIKNHPIKQMVDFGLNVTIGTDDLLFFDSDINEEYYTLYKNKVLTFEELEKIRKFGLSLYKN